MRVTIDMNDNQVTKQDGAETPETLRELAQRLRGISLPPDYVAGKTCLRDATMALIEDSAMVAERAVDRMIARGHINYDETARRWNIEPRSTVE